MNVVGWRNKIEQLEQFERKRKTSACGKLLIMHMLATLESSFSKNKKKRESKLVSSVALIDRETKNFCRRIVSMSKTLF